MAQLFADDIVALLRRETGDEPEGLSGDYFGSEQLKDVKWLPAYIYRTGTTVWAIELAREDYIAPVTLSEMQAARAKDANLTALVFVPRGESYEHLREVSNQTGLPLSVSTEAGYEILRARSGPAPAAIHHPTRIPPSLAEKVGRLSNLAEGFREPLMRYSEAHRELRGQPAGGNEEDLLKRTFRELIAADERFLGGHDPLAILRRVESLVSVKGDSPRDHYYHSFHNFLLGCLVLDSMYGDFSDYHSYCMPNAQFSMEYAWLLTAIYHDTGYLIQHAAGIDEALYGEVDLSGERTGSLPEFEFVRRQQQWQSMQGKIHRQQLVSLYDHLTQTDISDGWTAVTLLAGEVPDHPLDHALSINFMGADTHGAASAIRMIREIEQRMLSSKAPAETQQFVMRHVYLAALSIPFHDWRLRDALRRRGIITSLRTRRFPLASLLMFIDSIQDDRRDPAGLRFEDRDSLQDIEVVGHRVRAVVDPGRVKSLDDKRTEAKGVKSFLVEDGPEFEYPPEFLE